MVHTSSQHHARKHRKKKKIRIIMDDENVLESMSQRGLSIANYKSVEYPKEVKTLNGKKYIKKERKEKTKKKSCICMCCAHDLDWMI